MIYQSKYIKIFLVLSSLFSIVLFFIVLNSRYFQLNFFYIFAETILLAFFLLNIVVLFKANKKFQENFITIIFTLGVSIIIVEAILNINFIKKSAGLESGGKKYLIAKSQNIKYDTRTIYEFYFDQKDKKNLVINFHPLGHYYRDRNIFSGLLPFAGISNQKTIMCNESGKYELYDSDRFGFNNKDSIWDQNPEIVLIGDSFTHGFCVNNEKNLASNINKYSSKKVLNLGYMGSGPLSELGILNEYAKNFENKIFIWNYFETDIRNLSREKNIELMLKYLNEDFSQNLIKKQKILDKELKNYFQKIIKTKEKKKNQFKEFLKFYQIRLLISNFLPQKYRIAGPFESKVKKENNKFFDELVILEKILLVVKKKMINNNNKLLFVYLPQYDSVKSNEANILLDKTRIFNILKKLDINYLDTYEEVFLKQDDPLSLFPMALSGHYTDEAYNLLAEKITQSLKLNTLEK